ncbi:MAG: lipid-A-disaccharide synthase [Spirulinaceae cyanobacterium RM2_2_10]|nr:lipid-A-disaccharide synthase [bacterium]NJO19987.1 lipid-A-disaccharide synthase [Spirulinaceae cyanobacterium RM2_2_10]
MPADILILSNGPGEVTTWVRPVVQALRKQLGSDRDRLRISLILAPCNHATGNEANIARCYPEIDRVQEPQHFLKFLLTGKTAAAWDWRSRGCVLFLGGDQFFAVVIAKRLSYRSVIYAEWDARWYRWVDCFGAMSPSVRDPLPERYRSKVTIIGDLMADVGEAAILHAPNQEWVGLLPGSKAMKLAQGLPLACAIAEAIHHQRPQTRFGLPVAPTLTLPELAKFGDRTANPVIAKMGNITATLVQPDNAPPYLQTTHGVRIELWTAFPALEHLKQCQLCFTTVGANTAQLGAIAMPMLILIPTQQLEAMRAWDGLPGLLVNLPLVGTALAKIINGLIVPRLQQRQRLFAWPNIWASKEIVPEFIGELQPEPLAAIACDWLAHPEQLATIRHQLRRVRGEAGAAEKLTALVAKALALTQATATTVTGR